MGAGLLLCFLFSGGWGLERVGNLTAHVRLELDTQVLQQPLFDEPLRMLRALHALIEQRLVRGQGVVQRQATELDLAAIGGRQVLVEEGRGFRLVAEALAVGRRGRRLGSEIHHD